MRRTRSTFVLALTALATSGMLLSSPIASAYSALKLTIPVQLPQATQGKSYSYSLAQYATGGTGPSYIWNLTGALPSGLKLSPTKGTISGTVGKSAKVSSYTLRICATGAKRPVAGTAPNNTACSTTKIAVTKAGASPTPTTSGSITITTLDLPWAKERMMYRTTITAVGGTPPYRCAVAAGSKLPTGYAFAPATCILTGQGEILEAGTTQKKSAPFTVIVSDSSNPTRTARITYTLITTSISPTIATLSPVACVALVNCGSPVIARAAGGYPPYSFTSTQFAGGLPPLGMFVVTSGDTAVLTGTPASQTTPVAMGVCVKDTVGKEACGTLIVNIAPAPNFWVAVAKEGDDNAVISASSGTINCGPVCQGDYAGGTNLTLTATPSPGHIFSTWSSTTCSSTNSTCTFRVTANTAIVAKFTQVASGTYSGNINFPNLNPSGYTGCEATTIYRSITLTESTGGKIVGNVNNGQTITGNRVGSTITVTLQTVGGTKGPYNWQWDGTHLTGQLPAFCTDNATGNVIGEGSYQFSLAKS